MGQDDIILDTGRVEIDESSIVSGDEFALLADNAMHHLVLLSALLQLDRLRHRLRLRQPARVDCGPHLGCDPRFPGLGQVRAETGLDQDGEAGFQA